MMFHRFVYVYQRIFILWLNMSIMGSANHFWYAPKLKIEITPWLFNIAMENPTYKRRFLAGKIIYFYGSFSIATLNNQRVHEIAFFLKTFWGGSGKFTQRTIWPSSKMGLSCISLSVLETQGLSTVKLQNLLICDFFQWKNTTENKHVLLPVLDLMVLQAFCTPS